MNQEDKLKQEILSDAREKAEQIVVHARTEAEGLVKAARKESEAKRVARLSAAKAHAESECKSIFVNVEMEKMRRWLQRQEDCVDGLLQEALKKTEALSGADRVKSLESLAREAVQAIGGKPCMVLFNPKDGDVVTAEWMAGIAKGIFGEQAPVYQLKADTRVDGGILLEAADGSRQFDNSYRTRLSRLHENLRMIAAGK